MPVTRPLRRFQIAALLSLAPALLAVHPIHAQSPADTLGASPAGVMPQRRPPQDRAPCGPADPLRGRLIGGSTACSLGAGEGHVSLRGVAVTVIPVGAAVQASMGAGRGVVLGLSAAVTIDETRTFMGSLRVPLLHLGGLRVAGGGHVWRTQGDYGYYDRRSTVLAPYVVATAEATEGVVVTAQLSTSLLLQPSRLRARYRSRAPLNASAGIIVATGRRSRLVFEAGAPPSGEDGVVFNDAPLVVGAAVRTFGRQSAFEIGLVTFPREFDACEDSEAVICLPPVLPTVTFTRAFGRR